MFGILLSALYSHYFIFQSHVELDIKVDAPGKPVFKIYWAEEGQEFSEKNMQQVRINSHSKYLSNKHPGMFIGSLGNIDRLRIDPIEFEGKVTIKRIRFSQDGYEPIVLDSRESFAQLKPVQQIAHSGYAEGGLQLITSGADGQFELAVNAERTSFISRTNLIIIGVIFALAFATVYWLGFIYHNLLFVPGFLLVVLVLAFVMASISGIHTHPDEKTHLDAVEYYHQALLPPALDDPSIAHTFSDYGRSRLGSFEIFYPLAGYFTRLLNYLNLHYYISARMFGIMLLAIILIFALRSEAFRPLALPLLITPQAWYLFSYVNSDGFALFVATIMAYQVAGRESLLNRFLLEPSPSRYWLRAISLGGLVGLLLLLKANYYFFILFLCLYLIWRLATGDFPQRKLLFKRLGLLALIGLSLYGFRFALDRIANGFDAGTLREQLREQYAKPKFKPSTPLEQKNPSLYFKDRGYSLHQVLTKEGWGVRIVASSFGAYGYTQYLGGIAYFELVKIFGLLLLAVVMYRALVRGPPAIRYLFAAVSVASVTLILAALWIAWTTSFQAQGRYLLPILPMLGILFYHFEPGRKDRVFNSLVVIMFVISCYSFLYVGLANIGKVSYALS